MFKRRNLFKSLIGLFLAPDIPIVPRRLKAKDSTIISLMAKEIQEEIDNEMISRMIAESKKMHMYPNW